MHQGYNQGCQSLDGPIFLCNRGYQPVWVSTHPKMKNKNKLKMCLIWLNARSKEKK